MYSSNEAKKVNRIRYWRRTLKNKLYAIALLAIGAVPVIIIKDATLLILLAFIAVPMFFSNENWIM